jgi:hypothetical protein
MSISLTVENNVPEGLKAHRFKLHAALVKGIDAATVGVQADVIQNRLHGQVLHQRTGNLIRNIIGPGMFGGIEMIPIADGGEIITGTIGIGSTAKYGAVHEFGGTYTISAHTAHWGRGPGKGRTARVSSWNVQSHNVTFRERSFLRRSLTENLNNGKIRAWVEGQLAEAYK